MLPFVRCLRGLILLYLLFLASDALAEEQATPKEPSSLQAQPQLAYIGERRSETGFQNAQGSGVIMDASFRFLPGINLGFRSLGHGARLEDKRLYRLGFGPFADLSLGETLHLNFGMFLFKESADAGNTQKLYRSSGFGAMLDLSHDLAIGSDPNLKISFGPLATFQQGRIEAKADPALRSYQRSIAQGFKVGIKLPL